MERDKNHEIERPKVMRLRKVHDVSRAIGGQAGFSDLLSHILDVTISTMEARAAVIMLFDEDSNELIPVAQKGLSDEALTLLRFKIIHNICHCIVEHGKAIRCKDIVEQEKYEIIKDRLSYIDCFHFSPLEAKGEVIGLLGVMRDRDDFSPVEIEAFCALGSLAGIAVENARLYESLKEKERMTTNLSRYFSPHVIQNIMGKDECCTFKGECLDATILISDIEGFTKLAESVSPEKIVAILNRFLSENVEIVFRHRGTIDKFTGDGILAVFGAPFPTETHPLDAVKAALDMVNILDKLNHEWIKGGLPGLNIRLGVCTGPVICGNIGSERRMEFTVIGNTVNLASRLENLNKELGTKILISGDTFNRTKGSISVKKYADIPIRGISRTCSVYEVIDYQK